MTRKQKYIHDAKNLHLILINCRSLYPKISELKTICTMYNPCFVFCCETWLHEGINDNLISVSGYKILRRDRKHKRGGGLCTFYQNSLKVIQVELDLSIRTLNMFVLFVKTLYISLFIYHLVWQLIIFMTHLIVL